MANEVIEGEMVESLAIPSATAIEATTRGEIDIQISTAKRYPRSLHKFKDDAKSMACIDEETALSCWYTLPRAGKEITGPSTRLAEICACSWGNLRYGARIVGIDDDYVTVEGFCHDLERNQATTFEVLRGIKDKHGKRYKFDMIQVTAMAAASIAIRNAIFKIIPRAMVNAVLNEARKVARGDERSLATRRTALVEYFSKLKIKPSQLAKLCDKASVDDLTGDDILTLRNIAENIKNGEQSVAEVFQAEESTTASATGSDLARKAAEAAKNGTAKPEPANEPEKPKEPEVEAAKLTTATDAAIQDQCKRLRINWPTIKKDFSHQLPFLADRGHLRDLTEAEGKDLLELLQER